MNQLNMDQLLLNEDYETIIKECNQNKSDENQLFLGIAYYKKNQFELAEKIFETLHTTNPTNEITTYLIITKIKLEKLMEALHLYEALCKQENEHIIEFIKTNDFSSALNLTLFLKSIPLEAPKQECDSDELIDLVNANDYTKLSLALAEKTKSSS